MSERIRELHRELRSCQCRLGTSAESEDDFERVLLLAHALNNEVTAEYLREEAQSAAVSRRTLVTVARALLR